MQSDKRLEASNYGNDGSGHPLYAGDTRDTQDYARDHYFMLDQIGEVVQQIYGNVPVITEGGYVYLNGTDLTIGPLCAWIGTTKSIGANYASAPPANRTEPISARFVKMNGDRESEKYFPGGQGPIDLSALTATQYYVVTLKFTDDETEYETNDYKTRNKRAPGPESGATWTYKVSAFLTVEFNAISDFNSNVFNIGNIIQPISGKATVDQGAPNIPEFYGTHDELALAIIKVSTGEVYYPPFSLGVRNHQLGHTWRKFPRISASKLQLSTYAPRKAIKDSYAPDMSGGLILDPNFTLHGWHINDYQNSNWRLVNQTPSIADAAQQAYAIYDASIGGSDHAIYPLDKAGNRAVYSDILGVAETAGKTTRYALIEFVAAGGFDGDLRIFEERYSMGGNGPVFLSETFGTIYNAILSGANQRVAIATLVGGVLSNEEIRTLRFEVSGATTGTLKITHAQVLPDLPNINPQLIHSTAFRAILGDHLRRIQIASGSQQTFSFGSPAANVNMTYTDRLPFLVKGIMARMIDAGGSTIVNVPSSISPYLQGALEDQPIYLPISNYNVANGQARINGENTGTIVTFQVYELIL